MDSRRSARTTTSLPAPTDRTCQGYGQGAPRMTNKAFGFVAGHWNSRQRRLVKALAPPPVTSRDGDGASPSEYPRSNQPERR